MNWKEIFEYKDGKLYWLVSPRTRTKVGDEVGHLCKAGYVVTSYMKKSRLVHRIVWEMFNGEIPEGMNIDHVNHNRGDNRIENLRLATIFDNNQNKSKGKANSSGCVGVNWHKQAKKWCAEIHANGVKYYLGIYDDMNDAINARKLAEKMHGFHKNHGS